MPDAGRESGIWQGAKQVQLQDLESQWDTYKVSPVGLGDTIDWAITVSQRLCASFSIQATNLLQL